MQHAVRIQSAARGMLARRRVAKLRAVRDARRAFEAEQAAADAASAEARRRRQVERRLRPRQPSDFATLYNELEAWRLDQLAAIEASRAPPAERQAAMQHLLHQVQRRPPASPPLDQSQSGRRTRMHKRPGPEAGRSPTDVSGQE